jgi:hypothetical protein
MNKRLQRTARTPASSARPVDAGTSGVAHEQVDLSSARRSSSPALPNERDEKVGVTGGVQSARVQQGARDLKRGVQDTSRAPEANAAYKKLKR